MSQEKECLVWSTNFRLRGCPSSSKEKKWFVGSAISNPKLGGFTSSTYITTKVKKNCKSEQDLYCKSKKHMDKWIVGKGHGCNGKRGNILKEG